METWFIILISFFISLILKSLFTTLLFPSNIPSGKGKEKVTGKLPPRVPTLPFIGGFLWFRKSFFELGPLIGKLCSKYGPLITLQIGFQPTIFVSTHSLSYQALIKNGAATSNRPAGMPINDILSANRHDITTIPYGSTWRVLRRNLTSEILHPSNMKSYAFARKRVLGIMIRSLKQQSHEEGGDAFCVVDHFQYAMFSLLVLMCFGDNVDENQIKQVESVQCQLVLNFNRFNILSFLPRLGRILFRNRWNELLQLRRNQKDVFVPLIRARQKLKQEKLCKDKNGEDNKKKDFIASYADSLLDLCLPDENKKLDEEDVVSLCSEFLTAGTDTTTTALQWIMANLVKHPHIQAKLFAEINGVVESKEEEIKEEELQNMPYLKSVILEGLRLHPPFHFLLPHALTEDVALDGYVVPKNATVNFLVAEIGRDPNVWENPLEFKPERFMMRSDGNNNGGQVAVFDITGTKEIKMLPFGAGRRICPAYGLAMLHLEYFVGNLIWHFEWRAVDGIDVDLSEKQELTVVMKNPLRVHISPRIK